LATYAAIALGMLIIIIVGISIASKEGGNWGSLILVILIFLIIFPIIYKSNKCFQNKYLR
jgi:hypothetical protein